MEFRWSDFVIVISIVFLSKILFAVFFFLCVCSWKFALNTNLRNQCNRNHKGKSTHAIQNAHDKAIANVIRGLWYVFFFLLLLLLFLQYSISICIYFLLAIVPHTSFFFSFNSFSVFFFFFYLRFLCRFIELIYFFFFLKFVCSPVPLNIVLQVNVVKFAWWFHFTKQIKINKLY